MDTQAQCSKCEKELGKRKSYRCIRCEARYHLDCAAEVKESGCSACGGGVVRERTKARDRFAKDNAAASAHRNAWIAAGGCFCPAWLLADLALVSVLRLIWDDRMPSLVMVAALAFGFFCALGLSWAVVAFGKRRAKHDA